MDLVRLVSETLPEFRDWLADLARSRRKGEGRSAEPLPIKAGKTVDTARPTAVDKPQAEVKKPKADDKAQAVEVAKDV